MKDITQISQKFDLKVPFVRKCLSTIELLKPHIHKSEKNKTLVDGEGLRIFNEIGKLKGEGLSIPAIKKQLNDPIQDEVVKQEHVTSKEPSEAYSLSTQPPRERELMTHYETELNALRKEREQLHHERKELEHRLQDLVIKAESLSGELKALPEGKSPEELRKDYQEDRQKKQEAAYILGELKHSAGLLQGKKRKALIARLESLLMEKTEYHEK